MDLDLKARWSTLAVWILVGFVAVVSCSLNVVPTATLDGEHIPVGHDAFYHARRILDAVQDPAGFYQFDPKIHAPEGSLLVWPWGYDYLMAQIVRAGMAVGLAAKPIDILIWIPVAAVMISVGLLILIARRLSLSTWPAALAALCLALSATTQLLHSVGSVDHHFAEFIFVLASLATGLAWFRSPTLLSGVVLGTLFGAALAIHNGLFVLQVPFLATLLAKWLLGESPPRRPLFGFVAALLVCTVAVLIPSLPFQLGRFEFYTLSWFHLYTSACTAVLSLLLAWLKPNRNALLLLAAVGIAMLVPIVNEIAIAQSFLAGTLGTLNTITEMRSPLRAMAVNGPGYVTNFYSFLIWLAPLSFVVCAIQCWRERRSPRLIFWITSVWGLALLSTQLRMHYFGSFALYLPLLVIGCDHVARHPQVGRRTYLIATLVLLLAYIPQIRHELIAPTRPGADVSLELLHPIFAKMRQACAEDPGIVLADRSAGHYIRYFTDCSVIADNFLLTQQQFDKAAEVDRLFALPAGEIGKQAPYVKYVLVRPFSVSRKPGGGGYEYRFYSESARATIQLLLAPPEATPPGYTLIDQVRIDLQYEKVEPLTFARLYKLRRADASAADASVNNVSK